MMPGACTVPWNAGVPPRTQAVTMDVCEALKNPLWEGVLRTARMGASALDGRDAGAPDGDTHAITSRKDAVDQPAAGDVPPWQLEHCADRIGATSTSNTGGEGIVARSDEHATADVRSHATVHQGLLMRRYWGRTGKLTGALFVSAKTES